MAQPGVMIYFSLVPSLKRLTQEEQGALFCAILKYGMEQKEPDFQGVLGAVWDFVKQGLDRDAARYGALVLQKRYAVYVREVKKTGQTPLCYAAWCETEDAEREWSVSDDEHRYPITTTTPIPTTTTKSITNTKTKTNTDTNNRADKPHMCVKFIPPEVEEVRLYCQEKGYKVDPEQFVDYYCSNGWMVGKNKMKDWKAAVRSWNRKDEISGNRTEKRTEKVESIPLWTIGTVL